jgi:hypothetical protein
VESAGEPGGSSSVIIRTWKLEEQAANGADLREAVQAGEGFFDDHRDPIESVQLLSDVLRDWIGDSFADIFAFRLVTTLQDGSARETPRGSVVAVPHGQISEFFAGIGGVIIRGAENTVVRSWAPVLVVTFEAVDVAAISALISVPQDVVITPPVGSPATYRLVSYVRRAGPQFQGHATARVRTKTGSVKWLHLDDDHEPRMIAAGGEGFVMDSVRVGFYLLADYWAE